MQTSSADRIFIIQTDEMMNVYMDGGVEMEVKSGATPPVEKPIGTPPPAKVDNKNVGAILRKPPPPKGG
jgi:hypothetical protein